MSTFATTTKNGFIWMLGNAADNIARDLGVDEGKVAFYLRPVMNEASLWLSDEKALDFALVHKICTEDKDDETEEETSEEQTEDNALSFDLIDKIDDSVLDDAIDLSIRLRKTKLYEDEYLVCHDFGTTYCYPIYDHKNTPLFYLIVIPDCRTSAIEREICSKLRETIEKWCKENRMWIPKLNPRPARMAV